MKDNFVIQPVTWQTHAAPLKKLREEVFIKEQHVPVVLEWDDKDESAQHLLALSAAGEPVGCARLTADGSIGRMAVLKPWRGLGVGRALLAKALSIYQQQGVGHITLSAQVHAIPFYEKSGFKGCSEPYLDADILHIDMRLK